MNFKIISLDLWVSWSSLIHTRLLPWMCKWCHFHPRMDHHNNYPSISGWGGGGTALQLGFEMVQTQQLGNQKVSVYIEVPLASRETRRFCTYFCSHLDEYPLGRMQRLEQDSVLEEENHIIRQSRIFISWSTPTGPSEGIPALHQGISLLLVTSDRNIIGIG